MKCIKAIKEGKYSKVGDIIRLEDNEAYQKVDSGYWVFTKKSEWKELTRIPKEEINTESTKKVKKSTKVTKKSGKVNDQITDSVT